jgi:hypothetical protein
LSAINLYNLGYGVKTIQPILRHKSPRTTEIYLKNLGLGHVREALDELSHEKDKIDLTEECTGDSQRLNVKKKPFGEPSTPQTARGKLRVVK